MSKKKLPITAATTTPLSKKIEGNINVQTIQKMATIVFINLKGSKINMAALDPEEAEQILTPIVKMMLNEVSRYGGIAPYVTGHQILATFGTPVDLEDHGIRACLAAMSIKKYLKSLANGISMRCGINTGEVLLNILNDGDKITYEVTGADVNLAARMEQNAQSGRIQITTSTHNLIKDAIKTKLLGKVKAKGFTNEIDAYEPIAVKQNEFVKKIEQCSILKNQSAQKAAGMTRQHATILCADIKGSTALISGLSPKEAEAILGPAIKIMTRVVYENNGTVIHSAGDGIIASFGLPEPLEDYAIRGCLAAIFIQRELKHLREKGIYVRIGLNSGEVLLNAMGDSDYNVSGAAVDLAVYTEQNAEPGSVTMTKNTFALLRNIIEVERLNPVKVADLKEPIELYAAKDLKDNTSLSQIKDRPVFAPFVGRDKELSMLKESMISAEKGQGSVVGIKAEAGQGKSRLFYEFIRLEEATKFNIYLGGAYAHTHNVSLAPIRNLFFNLLNINRDTNPSFAKKTIQEYTEKIELDYAENAILSLLKFNVEDKEWNELVPQVKSKNILRAGTQLLFQEALKKPLLLIIEDLHWLDADSEEFLTFMIKDIARYKMLLILTYRPLYNASWKREKFYQEITLRALGKDADKIILDKIFGYDSSLDSLKIMLSEKSSGNPFFLEELIKSLIQDGVVIGSANNFQLSPSISMEDLELPESIYAVIQSEINKLPEEIKKILQIGSVIGQRYEYRLVEKISGDDPIFIRKAHNELVKIGHIYESQVQPELRYSFKHALIQDVSYHGLLKKTRKDLHGKILNILENSGKNYYKEFSILGHHAFLSDCFKKSFGYYSTATKNSFMDGKIDLTVALFENTKKCYDKIENKSKDDTNQLGLHYVDLTELYINFSEPKKAIYTAKKAMGCALKTDNLVINIRAKAGYSISYIILGNVKKGVYYAENAHELLEKISLIKAIGKIIKNSTMEIFYSAVNVLFFNKNKILYHFKKFYQPIMEIPAQNRLLKKGKSDACMTMIGAYLFTSEYDKIIASFKESERYRISSDYRVDDSSKSYTYALFAFFSRATIHIGKFNYIEHKIPLVESQMDINKIAFASFYWLLALGHVSASKGEFAKSEKIWLKAFEYQNELGSKVFTPEISIMVAITHTRINGKTETSKKKLYDAIKLLEDTDYIYLSALVFGYISEGLLIIEDYINAKKYNAKVLERVKQRKLLAQAAWLTRMGAEIDLKLPKPNYAEIKINLKKSMEECKRLKMSVQIAHCHFAFAKLYEATGDDTMRFKELKLAKEMYQQLDMNYFLMQIPPLPGDIDF